MQLVDTGNFSLGTKKFFVSGHHEPLTRHCVVVRVFMRSATTIAVWWIKIQTYKAEKWYIATYARGPLFRHQRIISKEKIKSHQLFDMFADVRLEFIFVDCFQGSAENWQTSKQRLGTKSKEKNDAWTYQFLFPLSLPPHQRHQA